MDEYIKREDAISAVCFGCNLEFSDRHCEPPDCEIRHAINAVPAADVVEVNRGKWSFKHPNGCYYCSCCGKGIKIKYGERAAIQWDFCPNCGANMKGE